MKTTVTSRLLKSREAMEYLGISRFTLQRLVHDGSLPVVQFGGDGGKWLIDRLDLDAFIARSKTTHPA
jgi:excisionase family DNA binding protein